MDTNTAAADLVTCHCCNHLVPRTVAPAVGDDAGWSAIAADHAADCEWVATRAGRLDTGIATEGERDGLEI